MGNDEQHRTATQPQGGLHRRQVLIGAAGAAILSSMPATANPVGVIATTRYGRVRGRNLRGVNIFQGVPYGADTAERRFLPPSPPKPWRDIRDALDFGNESPQPISTQMREDGATASTTLSTTRSYVDPRPQSEDCLCLNVYTPGMRDGAKRPVMVWIHGGGYANGSGGRPYAEGSRLAKRGDVVVVALNHRLTAFGYLYLAELSPEFAEARNVGNLDLVLALQWVRDNIAEFGGDPANVTIFGQSGGAAKVADLLAMPSAAGLFHKAIAQSGATLRALEPAEGTANARKFLEALNISPADAGKLRSVPMKTLQELAGRPGFNFRPVVDGRVMPRHPFDPDAPSISKDVPLLTGTTKDETTSLLGASDESLFHLTWEQLPGRLARALPGLDVATVIPAMRKIYPFARPSDIFFSATTEQWRCRTIRRAERKAALGAAPAFVYQLAWQTPVDGGKWKAPHSLEHAFVFDNVAPAWSMLGADRESNPDIPKLIDAMSTAWVNFARTGNPGWEPYSSETRATMVFNVTSMVVFDQGPVERRLFETVV